MADKTASGNLGKMKMFISTRFSTYIQKWSFLVLHFKNCVFTLTLYLQGKCIYTYPVPKKKSVPSNNYYEKKTSARSRYITKLSSCQLEVSLKNFADKGLIIFNYIINYSPVLVLIIVEYGCKAVLQI